MYNRTAFYQTNAQDPANRVMEPLQPAPQLNYVNNAVRVVNPMPVMYQVRVLTLKSKLIMFEKKKKLI